MIAEKIKMEVQILPRKYNLSIVLVCITSDKGVNSLSFSAIQQNTIQQKTKPGQAQSIVDGCSTRGLRTLQGMALTSHQQLQFNIPPKCGLYLSLSATVQYPSKMRQGIGWDVEIVRSILLQASASASFCLAERLPPKHSL